MSIYLDPELRDWLGDEARAQHITISELINRLLQQQRNLRKDLAALPESQGSVSVFQVLLERHGEKISQTVDNTARQMSLLLTSLDLLKTMVAHGARMGLTPKQFSQWEQDVQSTLKGHRA